MLGRSGDVDNRKLKCRNLMCDRCSRVNGREYICGCSIRVDGLKLMCGRSGRVGQENIGDGKMISAEQDPYP